MTEELMPPVQLGEPQRAALLLAGTVAVPSPSPASGLVSIGVFPPPPGVRRGEYEPTFYIRSVQIASDTHVITRYLRPEDVRAARIAPEEEPCAELSTWKLVMGPELRKQIRSAQQSLADSTSGGEIEAVLFPRPAILYVPESAPVLMRVEYGVTAAECVRDFHSMCPICCQTGPLQGNGDPP